MPWPFLLMELTLSSWVRTTGFCPLFWLLFGFWYVVVNPSLIHSNKSTHKISFIFVKTLQALFRDFHASAFVICCEQVRHPSCAKLFHIQFFMQNISFTFFWNTYSLSNFMHFRPPVIQYHIVHLVDDYWYCCAFWMSLTWIIFKAGTATIEPGSPFLNCWKRRRRVPINVYELRMNFIQR